MLSQITHQSHWKDDGTCSYCGSISADLFFKAIADGCELGPTDKNYKVYVRLKEAHPDELRVVSASSAVNRPDLGERDGFGWEIADPQVLKDHGWGSGYRWMLRAPKGPYRDAKFYFQHFTEDERKTFVELLNAKKLNIGMPGYFYRLPFFCQRVPSSSTT